MLNSFSFNGIDNLFNFLNLKEESTNKYNKLAAKTDNHPKCKNKSIFEQLTVGVFFHHRDVKVVLDDLSQAGFPLNSLTLMAQNCQRHNWLSDLRIFSHFENEIFSFSQECEQFFQRFFRRGKYILVVQGTDDMVQFAAQVLSRRRDHAKVWYLGKNY